MAATKVKPALLEELTSRILKALDPLRVVLFGSAATQDGKPVADLDVLVIVEDGTPTRAATREIYRKLIGFGHSVDVVVATSGDVTQHSDNPNLVFHSALKQGVELYAR